MRYCVVYLVCRLPLCVYFLGVVKNVTNNWTTFIHSFIFFSITFRLWEESVFSCIISSWAVRCCMFFPRVESSRVKGVVLITITFTIYIHIEVNSINPSVECRFGQSVIIHEQAANECYAIAIEIFNMLWRSGQEQIMQLRVLREVNYIDENIKCNCAIFSIYKLVSLIVLCAKIICEFRRKWYRRMSKRQVESSF